MQNEKVRLYHLAHELDMESKELLGLCRQQGIAVHNQLSWITTEQRDAIVALVRNKGAKSAEPPKPVALPHLPPRDVPNRIVIPQPPVVRTRPARTKDETAVPVPPVRQPPAAAVAPAMGKATDESASVATSRLERLCSLGKTLKLSSLERVAEQHGEDALKSMRKAAETVVRRAAKSPPKAPFHDAIKVLEDRISGKSLCFLHHVRAMGNVASHEEAARFTPEEINYLTRALTLALEEMIAQKLL